ncbi:MAG: TonB-dependent receptor [Pseudomonadota bacterium]
MRRMRFGQWASVLVVCGGVCALSARANAQSETAAESADSARPAITPPELTHFEPAPYPPAAAAEHLEASVVLTLDIDAAGLVTSAAVTEPAGHGFDEAAQNAALHFVFRPARRADQPVKSRILYRYAFHFQAPPQATETSAAKRASRLFGRVTVAGSKSPLAGARLRLLRGEAVLAERLTDADGRFDSGSLEAGAYRVSIEAAGFDSFTATEQIAPGEDSELHYGLVPLNAGSTTIIVQGTRPTREVTRHAVSRRELSMSPGTSGDALRAIENMPGVSRAPALSGLLVVRGNADQTTPVFVDGLWIPNVYHFGGLSSVVPTEMLDEVNFYPGNFSVRYGRALAGVVDAHLRETRADGRYHGLAQIDLIDARIMAEGPVPGLKGWNFIGGFRRSHIDAWLGPVLNQRDTYITAAPVYYDYQLLFDRRPTPDSYVRIGLLGFDDRFALINKNSATGGKLDTLNSTWGVGVIYKARLSPDVKLDMTVSAARAHQRFALSSSDIDLLAESVVTRGEFALKLWRGATLRTGWDAMAAPYRAYGAFPDTPGIDAPDIGMSVTLPSRRFDRSALFLNPALFAEMELHPTPRWQLVNGVRADYTFEIERLDVSPRMVARYTLVPGSLSTVLKAGTGLFQQAPDLVAMVLKNPNTELRSQRSFQNSLGVEQELSAQVKLSVEGFYNLLDNLISAQPNAHGVVDYNNYGKGRIIGSEVMLRYAADEHFFGWVSYTLSRSERTWLPGQPSRLFELDQTHILTALGSYRLGRGWELGMRFRYVTGNLYTPCRSSLFSSTGTSYVCVQGPLDSARLPAFHQLDVRVDKRFTFASWTLSVYLDLINAYNRKNPDFLQSNYDFSQSQPQSASLPIIPSLGVRGEL